jgi:CHAT domain-containing protein
MPTILAHIISVFAVLFSVSIQQPPPQESVLIPPPAEDNASRYLERGFGLLESADADSAGYYFDLADSVLSGRMRESYIDTMRVKLARGYFDLAERNRGNRSFRDAGVYHQKALSIRETLLGEDSPELGDSYYFMGVIDFILGRYNEGMPRLYRSIEVRRKAFGEASGEVGDGYNLLGSFYSVLDQYEQAESYYNRALSIRIALHGENHRDVAASYNNLGIVARNRDDLETALMYFYRAVDIRRTVDGADHPLIAENYSNISIVYSALGNNEDAIGYTMKGLELQRNAYGERDIVVARFYSNLGVHYRSLGEYDSALEFLGRSLELRLDLLGRTNNDVATTLNNIGVVYSLMGDHDTALDYLYDAAEIRREVFGDNNTTISASLTYIADVYREMGRYHTALGYYTEAIGAQVPGFSDAAAGAPDLSLFDSAIINVSLLTTLQKKAETRLLLYENDASDLNSLHVSLELFDAAIRVAEILRDSYSIERSKLILAESSHELFTRAVHASLLLYEATGRSEYTERAYAYAERSRATVLWHAMLDARIQSFAGIPEDVLERERQLNRALIQARVQYHRAESVPEEFNRRRAEYFARWQEFARFKEELQREYPRYHELRHDARPFTSIELQHLIDDDDAVLQYALGSERSYLFVITSSGLQHFILPPEREIEELADALRRSIRRFEVETFAAHGSALHAMLIEPAAAAIGSKRSLQIVPDGSLGSIPFEALLTRAPEEPIASYAGLPFMINQYTISYHYSGKLVADARTGLRGETGRSAQDTDYYFSGFAPVFGDAGIYAGHENGRQEDEVAAVYRAVLGNEEWYPELPYSRDELSSIADLFSESGYMPKAFFDGDASKTNFTHHAGRSSIVHVASHSFFNETSPMLSAILFARDTESGCGSAISPLYAGEIYAMDLNADLIVLSSCESGMGAIVRGEGMMAMTRGFLYAGAENIIVSLWRVTDRHTRDLMVGVYRNILDGKPYADALREAKLTLIRDEQTAFPAFWSGFVLIGI